MTSPFRDDGEALAWAQAKSETGHITFSVTCGAWFGQYCDKDKYETPAFRGPTAFRECAEYLRGMMPVPLDDSWGPPPPGATHALYLAPDIARTMQGGL